MESNGLREYFFNFAKLVKTAQRVYWKIFVFYIRGNILSFAEYRRNRRLRKKQTIFVNIRNMLTFSTTF